MDSEHGGRLLEMVMDLWIPRRRVPAAPGKVEPDCLHRPDLHICGARGTRERDPPTLSSTRSSGTLLVCEESSFFTKRNTKHVFPPPSIKAHDHHCRRCPDLHPPLRQAEVVQQVLDVPYLPTHPPTHPYVCLPAPRAPRPARE